MIIYAYFQSIFDRLTQESVLDLPLSWQEQKFDIWIKLLAFKYCTIVLHLRSGCMDQYYIKYMHPEWHPHLLAKFVIQYLYSILYLAIHKFST